jgi:hypothetical protein
MKIDFNRLQTGDRLVRLKGGVFTRHHAIYAGFWNSQHLVAENHKDSGVRYNTLNNFLMGGKIDRIEYNNFDYESQSEVIRRINKKLGSKYSFIGYNCENFVNEILTGISNSKQVRNGVLLAVSALVLGIVMRGSR